MNKEKLVYIEWADAFTTADGWMTKHEAIDWASDFKWIVKSIGWILHETDESILLASKKNDICDDTEPQYGLILKLPKSWIRKRKNITI